MSCRQLNAERTIETLQTLRNRISERFGDTSLAKVADELLQLASETRSRIEWIEKPNFGLRLAIGVLVLFAVVLAGFGINELLHTKRQAFSFADTVAVLESATNEIILVGAALAFLLSLEVRAKRTRAQKALHDLRAVAHVIDMHQLTKDPSQILNSEAAPTKSSPKRTLTPYLLTRYLDYCSEMLSLVGKLAALYAQSLHDPIVVSAVNEIETLTNGLSRKIWQKIVMLDDVARVIKHEPETTSESSLSDSTGPDQPSVS